MVGIVEPKLQTLFVYGTLLGGPGTGMVPTAGRFELQATPGDPGFPETGVVRPFPVPAAIDGGAGQVFRVSGDHYDRYDEPTCRAPDAPRALPLARNQRIGEHRGRCGIDHRWNVASALVCV
jgi:hypothetical protein